MSTETIRISRSNAGLQAAEPVVSLQPLPPGLKHRFHAMVKPVGALCAMTYKVHLDGYNLIPFLKGEAKESPRESFIYWTDDGSVAALRYRDYKIQFLKQTGIGLRAWQHPFEAQRAPLLTNLRMDRFERAESEGTEGYQKWYMEHRFAFGPAAGYVAQWLQSFREFPPRQKPGSFSLDRVMEAMTAPHTGSN